MKEWSANAALHSIHFAVDAYQIVTRSAGAR